VNAFCKFLLGICLCSAFMMPVQAQDAGLHSHPPQHQLLHEQFYSTWHMPTIQRLAVATMRTVTRRRSSTLTAASTQNAEKTEDLFAFHRTR